MSLREFIDRYGIAMGVLVALALVVVLLPANATDEDRAVIAGLEDLDGSGGNGLSGDLGGGVGLGGDLGGLPAGTGPNGGVAGFPGANTGGVPGATSSSPTGSNPGGSNPGVTGAAGTGPSHVFGEGPCRADGRQVGISVYMPPCVRWASGDNGGVTDRGVTRDKVIIARWVGEVDPGTRAILEGSGLFDQPETIERAYRQLFRYSNLHYETYGREVVFVNVPASGAPENEAAMKADALKIADEIGAFAVIDGDPAGPLPPVLARELAQRGVPCSCTSSMSSAYYLSMPPLVYGNLPAMDAYAETTAEYIAKKLLGKNAIYAGDEFNPAQNFTNTPRKFGIIVEEGQRSTFKEEYAQNGEAMVRALARWGVPVELKIGYIYDPGRNQQDMSNIIAQFKAAGVTTIIPIWDPLTPIILTQEATRQNYYPEWFVVGTGLSDTNAGGRLYDKFQWRHAFGISPLWVTWETVPASTGSREYHHATPGAQQGDEGILINIYRERVQMIFRGIHMAGPNLTVANWVKGLLAYPPTGGTAATPLRFVTRELPGDIQDFVEVWWDWDRQGPDERGDTKDTGIMVKADNGRRYRPGTWTSDPSLAFIDENVLDVSDELISDDPHERDGHTHPASQRCLSCA